MRSYLRLFGIGFVFVATSIAWLVLGGVTRERQDSQSGKLRSSVQTLWGNQQTQEAPRLLFHYETQHDLNRVETRDGAQVNVSERVTVPHERAVSLSSSAIDVLLRSDLRRKGLAWYSLYDVKFAAEYSYLHAGPESGELELSLAFPDAGAVYDDFRVLVDESDASAQLDPEKGKLVTRVKVVPGQRVLIRVGYASRGLDEWRYQPGEGVSNLEDFRLTMRTNFRDIDYPAGTLSPSHKVRDEQGYRLTWAFRRIVTGHGIGMITPSRIQPGELAAALATSAPVSLFFYFFVLFVLTARRGIDLHPISYLLIAGAFFSFHLLFAYSADHLPIEAAFALSSAVSVFLVVSYLRLVVSARFAYVEAASAQLVYLVGFSLAHFWTGFTGLTATVLAIATLYLLMQLTARVRWSQLLAGGSAVPT